MTVVAFDGAHVAVDRQFTRGDTKSAAAKWVRLQRRGGVAIMSGHVSRARAIIAWLDSAQRRADRFPVAHGPDDWSRVLLVADGTVTNFEDSPYGMAVDEFDAWGSGAQIAWGAMRAGASAADAVAITAERHTECGMGIDVFDLHGQPA